MNDILTMYNALVTHTLYQDMLLSIDDTIPLLMLTRLAEKNPQMTYNLFWLRSGQMKMKEPKNHFYP
jgi:hypothetical protein